MAVFPQQVQHRLYIAAACRVDILMDALEGQPLAEKSLMFTDLAVEIRPQIQIGKGVFRAPEAGAFIDPLNPFPVGNGGFLKWKHTSTSFLVFLILSYHKRQVILSQNTQRAKGSPCVNDE